MWGGLILLLLALAAARHPPAPAVSLWGVVESGRPGPCHDLSDWIAPCPGCRVWLDWQGEPLLPGTSARLSGRLVSDYGAECEILIVESAWGYAVSGHLRQ